MIVTTISKDRINSVSLPQKAAGQYWLYDDLAKASERLVSIEGLNGEWILKSNRKVKLLDSKGASIKNTIISPLSIYVLAKADGERTFVFTEPATEDRQVFTKYLTTHDIMGGSMLVGTLLLPTITKKYERSRKRKKEALRQKKYREYLDKITVQINEACQQQKEILNENIIPTNELKK